MTYKKQRLGGNQLLGVSNCPHCGISSPLLTLVFRPGDPVPRTDGGPKSHWSVFACTTCGHLVTAKGNPAETASNPLIVQIFPDIWEPDGVIPEQVSKYLSQAHSTLNSPDASVVMSESSIDAMLKKFDLSDGTLYARIDKAVENGILTQAMADWAHRVRLDANNPRHADEENPHMSADDAKRAFDFANALTEYLFILPSRMPPKKEGDK